MKGFGRYHMLLATFGNVGALPICPGTWGSLAALFVLLALRGNIILEVFFLVVFLFLGRYSAAHVERDIGIQDPACVVIDEVVGIFVTFFLIPRNVFVYIAGFFLFRILDMAKPPPARRSERVGNGWGVMLDDVVAGFYANLVLRVAVLFGLL